MNITALKEGNFAVIDDKEFDILNTDNGNNSLKMAIQPFLVEINNEYILLDVGLGWKMNEKPVIIELLEKQNIKPEQISRILLSHLHKDHVDGLFRLNNEQYEQNFPEAKIYIQKREYESVIQEREDPSYTFDVLDILPKLNNVVWMNEDSGNITEQISYEVTGGHTPFHQSFWLRDNGETAFYGADNLPQRAYLKYQIAYKTDHDGRKAMELRQIWQKQAEQEHWKILLYHDMRHPIIEM